LAAFAHSLGAFDNQAVVCYGLQVQQRVLSGREFFVTFSGKHIVVAEPQPEQIDIRDIAHSLAFSTRYNGACRTYLSIAQHCLNVADNLPMPLRLCGLLHDAAEAYVGDVITPVKKLLGEHYATLEAHYHSLIAKVFGVVFPFDALVRDMDRRVLLAEADAYIAGGSEQFNMGNDPAMISVRHLGPLDAETAFLRRFTELAPGRPDHGRIL
jgi:hypothetical protein